MSNVDSVKSCRLDFLNWKFLMCFLLCLMLLDDMDYTFPLLKYNCSFLQTEAAHSWTCMDLYVFATPYRITWDYYFSSREHTLKFDSWEEPAELEYVIFLFLLFIIVVNLF